MQNNMIHKVLANGLNVYLIEDKNKHTAIIDLIVKYGGFYSDFEVDGKKYHLNDGMAHLLEHIMFEKNCNGNFMNTYGSRQMNTNAITYPWITEYYVDLVENFDFALECMLTGLSKRVFTEEDLLEIKPPIYQEIRMRDDQVPRRAFYTRMKNLFKEYSYVSGLGSLKDVEGFTHEQVSLCFDTFYNPKNEILIIAGNFDAKETLKKIENIYKKLTFKEHNFNYIKVNEPQEVNKEYEVIEMPVAKDYIDISYKIDFSKYQGEERKKISYYLSLFLTMNFSNISPLYKKLIDKKIISKNISRDYDFYQDYLVISISSYVNNEEEFIKEVKNALNNPYENEEIFELSLRKFKMNTICADPTPGGIQNELKNNFYYFGYISFDTVEEVNALNYQEYLDFTRNLDFEHFTITKITNEK